jgi:regulation of enolase protein 1 (concanavalin A-like superfamily)
MYHIWWLEWDFTQNYYERGKIMKNFKFQFCKIFFWIIWLTLIFSSKALAYEHYDFIYSDRASLLSDGWDFLAVTSSGGIRDTEQTTGAVVSYDQVAHPGILRIPCDTGDLWAGLNNTRNTLFKDLPLNWTSIRLKLSFAPTQNYQQAGLLAYQDDNNYVQVTRIYENGNRVTFAREVNGNPRNISYVSEAATSNLHFRLDRDLNTESITAYYSLDGAVWTSLGSVTQTLSNPRLAIVVGASPSGFPNVDLAWAEVTTGGALPGSTLSIFPNNMVFSTVEGTAAPPSQILNIFHKGYYTLNWEQSDDASWLSATPTSGTTPENSTLSVNANGLSPGIYIGTVTVNAPLASNSPQTVQVTLIVNPNVPVKVSTWKDGHKGSLSVSVDDGHYWCFNELQRNGFTGSYFTNGTTPPLFYVTYFNAGMELGSHLRDHICTDQDDDALRYQQIEPNIQGICTNTPEPCEDVVTLDWPCGFTNTHEQAVASEYFLSARGYNFNQLEDTTPLNFLNLKSFNSHEHVPYPPADLKTVVDMAEQQGKWANLVLHTSCNDDGAIDYAATRDIWVAPIGTVIKYILQRDRSILSNYQETSDKITFSFNRLTLEPSPIRSFETAFGPADVITMQVDVDDARSIASVELNGTNYPYVLKMIDGNKFLLINTTIDTASTTVEVTYQTPAPPSIALNPNSLTFTATEGTNPANQTIALSNSGGGILSWTATADSAAPAWLSVSPTSGVGNATITVSVNTAGLSPGTYTKSITVAAPGATNTPQTVNVTLTVNPVPPPAIALNPNSLTFTAIEGTNPANQTIALSNSGGGILSWTATADSTAPAWLSVSPTSGVGNATITVSVNTAGLSPGTYTKSITVAAPGATNTPQTVNVTLTVNPVPPPAIALNPNSLTFTAIEGTNPANQTIALSNSGGGTLSWTATADSTAPAWLSVSPTSGVGNATLTVSVNTAGLSPGTYTKSITVAAPGATNTPQTVNVTLTVNPSGTGYYDFNYPDRASLIAAGWDFLARTPSGGIRDTEQTTGAVVSYDQMAHPGILRIPCDVGDLWASQNNTRNSLFRDLPSNWTSIRLKLSFAPTRNYQQAGLLAYQDDNNYVQVTRIYENGNRVTFAREVNGSPSIVNSFAEGVTSNLYLRLDRELATGKITAYYSLNGGADWISLGSVTQTLSNPRLAIFIGASPSGFPDADLSLAEVITGIVPPTILLSSNSLTFTTVEGTNPPNQTVLLSNSGGGTLSWTATADVTAPAWLSVAPISGVGNATLTVSVNSASLSFGTYTKTITVSAPGATNTPQTVNVTLTVNPVGTIHYDFNYPDRASLIAAGWDFLAVTSSGRIRDTEQTTGAVVSYDQVAHPGILRIPCDTGDLWASQNNTRNTLFKDLPLNWTSIRLKLSFAPTRNYQQAGLLAYQDDNNYVQVTRIYNNGNKVTFAREVNGSPSIVNSVLETAIGNLHLRLDRDLATQGITAYYSLNGADWISLGSVTQTLSNPRLAIFIGASLGGFPNVDLEWVEINVE